MTTELDMTNHSFRAGVLTVNLQFIGTAMIVAREALRRGKAGSAVETLDRAIASAESVLGQVAEADANAIARLIEPIMEEGEDA